MKSVLADVNHTKEAPVAVHTHHEHIHIHAHPSLKTRRSINSVVVSLIIKQNSQDFAKYL